MAPSSLDSFVTRNQNPGMPPRNAAPVDLSTRARALAERHGTARAAKALGISSESLARFSAGLGVRPGTVALVRERIAQAIAELEAPPLSAA